MIHKRVVYTPRPEPRFCTITVETPPAEGINANRIGVCFCGHHVVWDCDDCGWANRRARRLSPAQLAKRATEAERLDAQLTASFKVLGIPLD